MARRLPEEIDPYRLARLGQTIRGHLPIASMRRLADVVYNREGEVEVELSFGQSESGEAFVHGRIAGALELVCQRCLDAMPFPYDIKVNLALVGSKPDAERLDTGYEPLVVSDRLLVLSEIVEDELILALPLVPTHDDGRCVVHERYRANAGQESDLTTNPFRILGEMRDG